MKKRKPTEHLDRLASLFICIMLGFMCVLFLVASVAYLLSGDLIGIVCLFFGIAFGFLSYVGSVFYREIKADDNS
jgi:hypothetical protein